MRTSRRSAGSKQLIRSLCSNRRPRTIARAKSRSASARSPLLRDQEVADVALAHHVRATFGAHLAVGFDRVLVVELLQFLDGVDLGAHVALLEVTVNHARCERAAVAAVEGPSTNLDLARGEESLQAEQLVGLADQARERELGDA